MTEPLGRFWGAEDPAITTEDSDARKVGSHPYGQSIPLWGETPPPNKKQGLLILTPGVSGPGCLMEPVRARGRAGRIQPDPVPTAAPHAGPPPDPPIRQAAPRSFVPRHRYRGRPRLPGVGGMKGREVGGWMGAGDGCR